VRVKRRPRIYTIWAKCESQVVGFHKALYKSFKTLQEANIYVSTIESILYSDWRFYASSREVGLLDFKLHLIRNLGRI
jgi:viroplasmin and RNaseH domain-containing protein